MLLQRGPQPVDDWLNGVVGSEGKRMGHARGDCVGHSRERKLALDFVETAASVGGAPRASAAASRPSTRSSVCS